MFLLQREGLGAEVPSRAAVRIWALALASLGSERPTLSAVAFSTVFHLRLLL